MASLRAATSVSATCKCSRFGLVVQKRAQPDSQKKVCTEAMTVAMNVEGGETNHNLTPGLAAGLFALDRYSSLNVNVELLRNCIAAAVLLAAAFSAVLRKSHFNTEGITLIPAALAVEVLGYLAFLPAVACTAGVQLCQRVGGLLKENYTFYGALVSMGVATYYGHATAWFCGVYAIVAGAEVVKAIQGNKIPLLPIPTVLVAGFAFYQYATNGADYTQLITMCLVLGRLAWEAISGVKQLIDENK